MKLHKRDRPINHAVIYADDGSIYILIKHLFTGFSTYENYSLYTYDDETETVSNLPVARIQAHITSRRFKPHVNSSMALISWAIARGKITPNGDAKLNKEAMNILFVDWMNDFNTGSLDILTIAAP